jgi:hypothetical protein
MLSVVIYWLVSFLTSVNINNIVGENMNIYVIIVVAVCSMLFGAFIALRIRNMRDRAILQVDRYIAEFHNTSGCGKALEYFERGVYLINLWHFQASVLGGIEGFHNLAVRALDLKLRTSIQQLEELMEEEGRDPKSTATLGAEIHSLETNLRIIKRNYTFPPKKTQVEKVAVN